MLPHLLQSKAVQKTVKDALVLEGFKGLLGVGRSGGFRVITRTSVSLSTCYVPDSTHF